MVCHASGDPPFLAPLFISATFGASDHTHCGDPLISIPWCDTRYRSTFPILFTGHTRSFSLFHVRSPMSIMRKLPYVISRPTDWAFSDGSASCIRNPAQSTPACPAPANGTSIAFPPAEITLTSIPLIGIVSPGRSEEHTSELQSLRHLVCRLLLEKII